MRELSLEELLEIAPLAHARPEVLVPTSRRVSWVHSSEIYEIAPLLDGGEVLLTTGLGLVGANDDALARYVEEIAARGATALVLELGRTFVSPPAALVEACTRTGLGLVVLHAVVAFVRIARVANERLLDHEAAGLRRADAVARHLTDTLRNRTGIQSMVATIAEHATTPVQLVDRHGRLHAGAATLPAPTLRREVVLASGVWGGLVAHDTGDPCLGLLLDRGADALAVAVSELHDGRRPDAARTLLLDLVAGSVRGAEAVARRAGLLGVPADRPVVALVAVCDRPHPDLAAIVGTTLGETVRTDLVAATDDRVLAVAAANAARRAKATLLLERLDVALTGTARLRHLAVGTPVAQLQHVPDSFGAALLAAATATKLGSRRRLVLPSDAALDHLLVEAGDAALERFVARALGPLLDHDATRRSELLPTLVAFLAAGRSKSAAAERLGVRRQTVHERLERLTSMLDVAGDDADALTTLEVAVRAWQVRTAGVQGPPARTSQADRPETLREKW